MKDSIKCSAVKCSTPEQIDRAVLPAEMALDALHDLAEQGDASAMLELVRVLSKYVYKLNLLSHGEYQPIISLLAANHTAWPALMYAHPEHRAVMEEHVYKVLSVGTLGPLRTRGMRPFSFTSQWNALAYQLWRDMNEDKKNGMRAGATRTNPQGGIGFSDLPPFTRETANQWWNKAKQILKLRHGDFISHEMFKPLWDAEREKEASRKKTEGRYFVPLSKADFRSNVRKRINDAMKQAFRTLAVRGR